MVPRFKHAINSHIFYIFYCYYLQSMNIIVCLNFVYLWDTHVPHVLQWLLYFGFFVFIFYFLVEIGVHLQNQKIE